MTVTRTHRETGSETEHTMLGVIQELSDSGAWIAERWFGADKIEGALLLGHEAITAYAKYRIS